MKVQTIKRIALALCALPLSAHALFGSEGRGGGDLCENRIKIIRDDIKSWINNGGPESLDLPAGVSVQRYSSAMLNAITTARINCVGSGDKGYPVRIDGTAKYCRFDKGFLGSKITCDNSKLMATRDSDQYILIHHELAGLAGVEVPNNDDSDYTVSNQISGFLVTEVIKKLAVKPQGPIVQRPTGKLSPDKMVMYDHRTYNGEQIYMPQLKGVDGNYYPLGVKNYPMASDNSVNAPGSASFAVTDAICTSMSDGFKYKRTDGQSLFSVAVSEMADSEQYVTGLYGSPQTYHPGPHGDRLFKVTMVPCVWIPDSATPDYHINIDVGP
jgi:hypothetical protein